MAESIISNTHENDVIFNMDSLREFIKLIKRQGTENIDFYAVSELLQPPGDNLMVSTPTGHKDENLEAWKELYNNTQRIEIENTLTKEYFTRTRDFNGNALDSYHRYFDIEMWLYTPPIYTQEIVNNKIQSSIRPGEEASFKQVQPKDLQDEYVVRRAFNTQDGDGQTLNDITIKTNFKTDYAEKPINAYFQLPFNIYQKEESKIENGEEIVTTYELIYFNTLSELLTNISKGQPLLNNITRNYFLINPPIQLYLSQPPMPEGSSTPQLYFVLKPEDKNELINMLSAYYNYNNQINRLKDEKFITVYEKKPIQNDENYPWWYFIYTKYNGSMTYEKNEQIEYYREFNENELKANPGKIVIVRKIHPWQQDTITDNNSTDDVNIKTGRHLYVQAGSLLKFNPGQSTENKDEIDDYWTDTTPGTFSIDENDGQKAHIITIRGFDQDGNFNNKNPIVGYTSQNDIPSNTDVDGAYKIGNDNYNLTPEQLAALQQQPDVPVYLNGTVIGYIKSKDIPKELTEDGEYEINNQKYDLDPNLIIPLAQANIIPVYLNNNNASITSHEGNFDTVGNSDNYVPDGYFTNLHLAGDGLESSGILKITNDTEAGRPTVEEASPGQDVALVNLQGSIITAGGIAASKNIMAKRVYAAVFNDYAECRKTINLEPGRVVIDNDDGSLSCANARLLPGAQVISDTYGNLIGEMPDAQTPIAVSGRVLVYPYQNRNNYHAGMAVCSAPNGTIDIMTREEIREYPDCIIGIVSEIPNYEKWGSDQVDVNNRIWIKVK